MKLALLLHLLGVVVWVGGMFFAYMALRPVAATVLEPPQRLMLWTGTFARFFPWVWAAVVLILATGLILIFGRGGFAAVSPYIHVMFLAGIVMMLIFFYIFFMPFSELKRGVATQEWSRAAKALASIRVLVGVNLVLGLLTIAIAKLGPLLG
ncbi:MAG TPA: hypothetical protein DEP05_03740 [Betaproteobacteria bacterium]|nr:hypothetical protein [Betaproteobacteria bacterium]